MVSIWKNGYIVDCLTEDYEKHLKSYGENDLNNLYKALLASLEKCSCYADASLQVINAWEQLTQFPIVDVKEQVAVHVECLARATRHVTLAGEWMEMEKANKERLELILKKIVSIGAGRKEIVEGVANLAAKPWSSSTVTNLLMGKSELQQQVLQLVSAEGVEGVLLRLDLLVESGLDSPAYKFASAVTTSLLADHIVFKSYVTSCKPGTLERIVDIFLALAVSSKHESKLYKVLRLLGIEDVNKIYVPHFVGFLEQHERNSVSVKQENVEEPHLQKPEDNVAKDQETRDETESIETKKCEDLGRCDRLFTRVVCLKMLQVFHQWSVAGISLKECPDDLQNEIITRWMEFNFKESGKSFKMLQDVESLAKTASQTSFLYNMAYKLWKQLGKDVEEVCLKMFVKGLTHDLNAQEAAKKDKTAKAEIEARMARAFVLMAEVVDDRLALCRECVLTAFSIKPSEQLLDRLRQLAKLSGFDNLSEHVENIDIKEETVSDNVSGIHCRVAFSLGDPSKIKGRRSFSKAYPAATAGKSKAGNEEPTGIKIKILNDKKAKTIEFKERDLEDLNICCDSMLDSTEFSRVRTKLRSNMSKDKKKFRNLEGILAIQGELITQASNYDPLDEPCTSLRHDNLNLSKELTDDLLIVLSAPRWHLLSWVMEWSELEKVSTRLLKDPTLREPKEDLKFLNIDYTQFDEWSSDEEITIYTGIERGYEQWLTMGSDEDSFEERGMSPGNEEELVFNATHTVERPDFKNPDCFLLPEDYLPNKQGKGDATEMETSDKEEELTFKTDAIASKDEVSSKTDLPKVTTNSIDEHEKDLEPEPEKSKCPAADMPKNETEVVGGTDNDMEVNFAVLDSPHVTSLENMSSQRLLGRMLLSRVVPGLEGTAIPPPEVTQIFMVQITTAGGPVTPGKPPQRHLVVVGSNSQSIVTTSGPTFLLRPGPSGITVAASARSITAPPTNSTPRPSPSTPTTIRLTSPSASIRPTLSPIIMSPSPSPIRGTGVAPNKKIQYICKQGNQTFVVDYPMSAAVLEKMRAGGGGLQLRLPVGALRPVSLPETITSQASSSDSNLPKFQFAFGQSPTPSPAPEDKTKSVPASPSSSCSSVTVPEHGREDEGLAGRLGSLLFPESAGSVSTAPPTSGEVSVSSVRGTASVPVTPSSTSSQVKQLPSQAVLVSAGLTTVQDKKPDAEVCVKQEVGATIISSSATQGPADLIRQLNLARAQGLVVLQQWGDKQVLVHKATGRWIMRQGSRLVTVPPQALGITPSQAEHPGPPSTPPSPAISSRTMEQLAEFDSILESKFKTCESPGPGESPPSPLSAAALSPLKSVVVVAAPPGPGGSPTRQIIQLPTTPIKKEALMSPDKATAALLNKAMPPKLSPTKVHTCPATFPKPPPKPQEDPETLKRIQAILDDYNDQIRNSPDLHNRPAPRRRTNGTGNPDSPTAGSEFTDSPPGPSSGSTSPNNLKRKKPGMSPGKMNPGEDALSLAVAEIKETGTISLQQPAGIEPGQVTSVRLVPKPVVPASPGSGTTSPRQIRQIMVPNALAASLGGQRLMVVSSGDGRRMVAVRPVLVTTSPGSPVIQHVVTSSSITRPIGLPPLPVSISLPTSPVPVSTVATLLKLESPSPSLVQSGRPLDRPGSPGLGIPMEMTPGQIMEAEMSATMMENPTSPFHNPHSVGLSPPCSEEQVPNCLPENVFSGEGMGYTLDASHEEVITTTTQDNHNGFPVDRIVLPNTPSSGSVCDESRAEQSSYLSDASIDLPSDASDLHDLNEYSDAAKNLHYEYSDASKNLHNYHSVKLDNDDSSNRVSSNLEMPTPGQLTNDALFDKINDHSSSSSSSHNNDVFSKTSDHNNVVFAMAGNTNNVIFTKTSDHNNANNVVFAKASDHNVVFAKASDHNNVVFTKRERRSSARGQKQDSEVTSTDLLETLSTSMLSTSTRRRSGRCDEGVTPENKKLKKNNSTEDLDLSTRHSPRNKSSKIHEKTDIDKLLSSGSSSSTKRQNSPSKPAISPSEGGVSTRKQKRK